MTQTALLGDEIELAYGKGLPQRKRIAGDFPVFGSNGQVDTHNKALIKGPGIIVGRKGSVGEVIWSENDYWPIDTTYYVRLKNSDDSLKYWYYQLKTLGLNYLNSHSAIPGLNRDVAYVKTVVKRTPDEQNKIAGILGSIDEKIELNRKMNETLEQVGKALFRHYFTDGPEAADWDKVRIKDVASYIGRGISPKYNEDGLSLVVNQRCIRDGRLNLTNARRQSKTFGEEKLLKTGDILINSTGVGTLGRVAQVDEIPENITFDSHVTVVRPNIDSYFFGEMMRSLEPVFESMGSGTTGQTELNRTAVGEVELNLPPSDKIAKFSKEVSPMREQMQENDREIQTLITLRDTLLPRLISGKVKV